MTDPFGNFYLTKKEERMGAVPVPPIPPLWLPWFAVALAAMAGPPPRPIRTRCTPARSARPERSVGGWPRIAADAGRPIMTNEHKRDQNMDLEK